MVWSGVYSCQTFVWSFQKSGVQPSLSPERPPTPEAVGARLRPASVGDAARVGDEDASLLMGPRVTVGRAVGADAVQAASSVAITVITPRILCPLVVCRPASRRCRASQGLPRKTR